MEQPVEIFLSDYQVPPYLIDTTNLTFELFEDHALVKSELALKLNPEAKEQADLVLDGIDLELISIELNGEVLSQEQYTKTDENLTLSASLLASTIEFNLTVVTKIKPQENTSLEGLYKSQTMFCTQCEAEGFRKITYYPDRPDVMSVFTTTVIADGDKYPVLLSNGNEVSRDVISDGRLSVTWNDPFKKPAYLFALVAGNLSPIDDEFTTMSGRKVKLRIFVEPKDLDKCDHAMLSLKNSMRWDEEVYGREYDLDIFMIVAVDDFNMGAMENKGLNIFNTSCVLANPKTTTDIGFQRVEAVVAHEYFHNWSGNRVTCRDWFQLSLKEGFTVFRDAQFSSDMNSETVKRVEDVSLLRTLQFAEDSGPMAHPVRPASFIEISNFYTLTIYEKGAEVVRMIHTLLGPELFRAGSDLYFERHDGQAVTCDDFVAAMEAVSGKDLSQFKHWYSQAGTPSLTVNGVYDESAETFTLNVKQSAGDSPKQKAEQKQPYHIPFALALLGDAGQLKLNLKGKEPDTETSDNTQMVLDVTEPEQSFVFTDVKEKPVPSLLRGFSAPVKMAYPYTRNELLFLMQNDSDGFCRWDACQQLGQQTIEQQMIRFKEEESAELGCDDDLIEAYRSLLADTSLDKAMVANMLQLPSEAYLSEQADVIDVEAIHAARSGVRLAIAKALKDDLLRVYNDNQTSDEYQPTAEQVAARALKNTALSYLMLVADNDILEACHDQFIQADNMTDVAAALSALVNCTHDDSSELKTLALAQFYEQWKDEALVVNQWFQVQSTCQLPNQLEVVKSLMEHPAFDFKNPNKLRSVVGAFCGGNAINFHQKDGAGYVFLADQILKLNKSNPQIASRLLTPLTRWKKYPEDRAKQMRDQLERINAEPELSKDVFEVVSKSLN